MARGSSISTKPWKRLVRSRDLCTAYFADQGHNVATSSFQSWPIIVGYNVARD